jgi:hypothetical protein
MPANIIQFNPNTEPMHRVVQGLAMIRDGIALLGEARAIVFEMCDGGEPDAAGDCDIFATTGNFQSGDYGTPEAAAFASINEVKALYAKLIRTDGGDNIGLALPQACARHGV